MSKLLSFLALTFGALFLLVPSASAATLTVCASGCDHTTITAAKNAASSGDTISVQASYAPAGESFPVSLSTSNLTISCASGATIGQTVANGNNSFALTTSSTVSGCGLSNINFSTGSGYVSGITISGNSAVGTATTTLSFGSQIGYMSITNNQNLDNIKLQGTSTNVTIQGNTFYGDVYNNVSGVLLGISATSTALTVTENYFESRITSIPGGSNLKLIDILGQSVTFTTNTVRYIEQAPSSIVGTMYVQTTGASPTVIIRGNKIEGPYRGDSDPAPALSLLPGSNMNQSVTVTVKNNTFRNRMATGGPLKISDSGLSASISFAATIQNNLFFTAVSTVASAMEFDRGAGNAITAMILDNAVYGSFVGNVQNQSSSNVGSGSGYITFNPHLQISDADTSNDNDVAPFSLLLNIDGAGTRIGATTTTRRTTVYVDDSGTIDYSTVDALTPGSVTSTLRSGDTLSLAAGTYDGFEIGNSYTTTSLTIAGAGVSTIINAGTHANGISLSGVTTSTLSGFVVQNASSTIIGYTATLMNFRFGGADYDDAVAPLGLDANHTVFVLNEDVDGIPIAADGDSVSSMTGIGTENFDLALMDFGGAKATFILPTSLFATQEDAETAWGGFGLVFDKFIKNVFTVSGGVYTYQSATVAAQSVTVKSGLSTPAISQSTPTYYAGIKLASSGGATISNVTSTVNGIGIWFASGGDSRIYDSVLSSNLGYDIRQGASVTNTVDNVTFTRTSSTVDALAAPILVKVRARALVRGSETPSTVISGATVSVTDASATATSLGATDGDGYTAYARLPAYTITSASADTTNGGYNPYSVASTGNTGYDTFVETQLLSSRDQTLEVDLVSNLAATPGAPSLTATGRTTATVTMTANGNGSTIQYLLYNSTLSSYVTSTGAAVSTPYWATAATWAGITISDLTCATTYSFVAVARNGDEIQTSTSTAGTVSTSACASSGSSGGGGGGGVGASGSTFIPLPITTPAPITTTPVAPLTPVVVADPVVTPVVPTPVTLAPAAPATVRTVQADARSFGVTVSTEDQERLASFIETGTSPETQALGSGERRALVRDALQTMGRSNIPLADLERMARGEIPATRNITIERQQLPRVRATFRSIFNRDPNFQNANENLVWNTMMYRIRFTRNLAEEREGIQDFRALFNRTPTDPFQWAVVRALGYVL